MIDGQQDIIAAHAVNRAHAIWWLTVAALALLGVFWLVY
jgi:hypothetical protein